MFGGPICLRLAAGWAQDAARRPLQTRAVVCGRQSAADSLRQTVCGGLVHELSQCCFRAQPCFVRARTEQVVENKVNKERPSLCQVPNWAPRSSPDASGQKWLAAAGRSTACRWKELAKLKFRFKLAPPLPFRGPTFHQMGAQLNCNGAATGGVWGAWPQVWPPQRAPNGLRVAAARPVVADVTRMLARLFSLFVLSDRGCSSGRAAETVEASLRGASLSQRLAGVLLQRSVVAPIRLARAASLAAADLAAAK